eukprot:Nitzschia sp. Nitz4//scaffold24_size164493//822//1220//NITZ4_002301-RA/size164493-processed-gene-0.25-mRNA-1//1//CDS//3329544033//4827//frame0
MNMNSKRTIISSDSDDDESTAPNQDMDSFMQEQHSYYNNHKDEYFSWEMEEAPLVLDRFGSVMDTQKELNFHGTTLLPPVRRVSITLDFSTKTKKVVVEHHDGSWKKAMSVCKKSLLDDHEPDPIEARHMTT